MATLFLVCGIPGSGKSTFLSQFVKKSSSLIISRDKIRFSLLKDGEDYFAHEPIVEQMFYTGISKALELGYDVFADQSSISPSARRKIKNRVHGFSEINIIWIDTPIEVCIERDSKREGRARVGEKVIKNMLANFTPPTFEEGFANIYKYKDETLIKIKKGDDHTK